jgi:Holliday junction resolvasome RuvABC endonuclease subunit
MRVIALDLGTATGFAYDDPHDGLICGTWNLASAKEVTAWGKDRSTRRNDPRISRLYDLILAAQEKNHFDIAIFEDVQFSSSTYQVQLWSSFRAACWLAFRKYQTGVRIDCVPVKTLKSFATGNGNADKAAMMSAAKRKKLLDDPTEFDDLDDNAIDALHLYDWAQKNLGRMKL